MYFDGTFKPDYLRGINMLNYARLSLITSLFHLLVESSSHISFNIAIANFSEFALIICRWNQNWPSPNRAKFNALVCLKALWMHGLWQESDDSESPHENPRTGSGSWRNGSTGREGESDCYQIQESRCRQVSNIVFLHGMCFEMPLRNLLFKACRSMFYQQYL